MSLPDLPGYFRIAFQGVITSQGDTPEEAIRNFLSHDFTIIEVEGTPRTYSVAAVQKETSNI